MNRFQDKVVMITGATSGIGKTTAINFANEGAKVALAGRRQAEGDAVVKAIESAGGVAFFLPTDVSVEAEVKHLVDETVKRFGRLDCALNNAAIPGRITDVDGNVISPIGPLTEYSEADWDDVMNINLKGVWLCLKHQIKAMIALKNGGSIANMASLWGVGASAIGVTPYIASKHGVIGLTKAAALENAANGIRVNAICPAWVPTEANAPVLSDPEVRKQIEASHPIGRMGTQEEIAEAVLWLCSDKTGFITGHSLMADGGLSAQC